MNCAIVRELVRILDMLAWNKDAFYLNIHTYCFREPSLKGVDITTIGVKDDNAAKDDLYGLVNGVNEDLYGYLSKSKESRI